ncbi:MAG: hypothetical protein ISP74_01980 [Bacteroidia bacterium]|nr:hypothetical protein [Bacteroidia bacterium]
MKYFIIIVPLFLLLSCDSDNEIIGEWQIIDVQLDEMDTIGLAGFVFVALSEQFPRPTVLRLDADSVYMFADNEKIISESCHIISKENRFYQLKVGEEDASFKLEHKERAVFFVKNMTYFLERF